LPGNNVAVFPTLDRALEWCEDELLRREAHPAAPAEVELTEHELFVGLNEVEQALVAAELRPVRLEPGSLLVREGEEADELYLVLAGELSVVRTVGLGHSRRLGTFSAGMTVGELGYLERGVRSADVVADSLADCRALRYAVLDRLAVDEPRLYAKVLRRIPWSVASLRHANLEFDNDLG